MYDHIRAAMVFPGASSGERVSSVATTCAARTRSHISSYTGLAIAATSWQHWHIVERAMASPARPKMFSSRYSGM